MLPAANRENRPNSLERIRQLEPSGESTRLGQGVRSILNDLRGTPPSAIVLFTDGVNTEGESLAERRGLRPPQGRAAVHGSAGQRTSGPRPGGQRSVGRRRGIRRRRGEFRIQAHRSRLRRQARRRGAAREKQACAAGQGDGHSRAPTAKRRNVRIPYRPTQVGEFEYVVEVPGLPDEAAVGQQPAGAAGERAQGPDPRAHRASLSELRVPLSRSICSSAIPPSKYTPSCKRPTRATPKSTRRRCGRFPCGARSCSLRRGDLRRRQSRRSSAQA